MDALNRWTELTLALMLQIRHIEPEEDADGSDLDWSDPRRTDHDERFDRLFAAYTPGLDCLFGDAPMPVNVFPTFFNDTGRLALQSNTTFISDAATTPDAGMGAC